MELHKAVTLAEEIIRIIKPYCNKLEIAGSVRRKKEIVKDIELVVTTPDVKTLKNKLGLFLLKENKIPFLKSGNKYINFLYKGYKFDLFVAAEDNFGLTFLSRTGSAEFTTRMLAHWKKITSGGSSVNGYLHDKEGNKYLTPTEESVFELLMLNFVDPKFRH
ncbi:MAG: hypothetical protein ABI462_13750 [Ignavibacteria bacterium]